MLVDVTTLTLRKIAAVSSPPPPRALIDRFLAATKGLSQKQIAEIAGVSAGNIGHWQNGRYPSRGIADATEVRLEAFLARKSGRGALAEALEALETIQSLALSAKVGLLALAEVESTPDALGTRGRGALRAAEEGPGYSAPAARAPRKRRQG